MSTTNEEQAGYSDYTDYTQEHKYETVPGVVQLPIAQRTSGSRLIRLHGGYGKRTVEWTAARFGRPPIIPAAKNTNGDTLLGTVIVPKLPRPNEQAAGFDWRVSGTYTYAQNTARVPGTDAFPVGKHPYALTMQDTISEQILQQYSQTGFTALYTAVGDDTVDYETGNWVWPFLALAPIFSSDNLIGG